MQFLGNRLLEVTTKKNCCSTVRTFLPALQVGPRTVGLAGNLTGCSAVPGQGRIVFARPMLVACRRHSTNKRGKLGLPGAPPVGSKKCCNGIIKDTSDWLRVHSKRGVTLVCAGSGKERCRLDDHDMCNDHRMAVLIRRLRSWLVRKPLWRAGIFLTVASYIAGMGRRRFLQSCSVGPSRVRGEK